MKPQELKHFTACGADSGMCICGARIFGVPAGTAFPCSRGQSTTVTTDFWYCEKECGAIGETYEQALRNKQERDTTDFLAELANEYAPEMDRHISLAVKTVDHMVDGLIERDKELKGVRMLH
jgi:hypothetical protein